VNEDFSKEPTTGPRVVDAPLRYRSLRHLADESLALPFFPLLVESDSKKSRLMSGRQGLASSARPMTAYHHVGLAKVGIPDVLNRVKAEAIW